MLAIIFIIIGGIQIVTGNTGENIDKGKNTITWAIVGLFLSIFSYVIVVILNRFFE